MNFYRSERLQKLSELTVGDGYFIDNELQQLISKEETKYVFSGMYGTYVANRPMMETHLKEGIFTVKFFK